MKKTDEVHCLVVQSKSPDPRAKTLLETARALLEDTKITDTTLLSIEVSDLYFIDGKPNKKQLERLRSQVLSDTVAQVASWQDSAQRNQIANSVEVAFRPGVTDTTSEEIVRISGVLGLPITRAATGKRFVVEGNLSEAQLQTLAKNLFANDVIQHFSFGAIAPSFPETVAASNLVEIIPVRELSSDALLELSRTRRAALDLVEMQTVQAYYRKENRDPSDIEFEMIAQTWSEHCVHKTFRAKIQASSGTETNGLLKTYIRAATEKINKPWVRSAFVDNAGVIKFDEETDLAFKVETHNHPSALEPFGGANTGVGGVIRDVLAMGAKPIAVTDVLCFGNLEQHTLPSGVLHPKRIQAGVVAGIEDYGNKMGIPTVNGAIFYDDRYTANPLVYCGCLGLMPTSEKNNSPLEASPGDFIVAIGGRTGRDGLRGATFSSLEMDNTTAEIAGASVQIGNPIVEKQVQEVILQARQENLYSAMTDCGAGGFSSAVGEMAKSIGAIVRLENISLKYPGLAPWEMWLSEAQERMVLAVQPDKLNRLQELCELQAVEAIVLGEFTSTGRLEILHNQKTVAELDLHFLHEAVPQKTLLAETNATKPSRLSEIPAIKTELALEKLLNHPNIKSREPIVRRYDHEVGGRSVVKPMVGLANHGPSDAAVLLPRPGISDRGVVLANGLCPQFEDAYTMAWLAIDEAIRNAVCVGADPDHIAILDNFCWGNPNLPDRMGTLLEASRGCHDAAIAYGTPFISGKDSLYNEYTDADGNRHAIPGTLLISAVGIVPDAKLAVTMDFKKPGNHLYLLGENTGALGNSHLAQIFGFHGGHIPAPIENPLPRYRALHTAMQQALVAAAHDCSEGGLAVTLSEMCIAGRMGATIQLEANNAAALSTTATLFGEDAGRMVLEVAPEQTAQFETVMAGLPLTKIGTTGGETLVIKNLQKILLTKNISELEIWWRGELASISATTPNTKTSKQDIHKNISINTTNNKPKALILKAIGSNRDPDVSLALEMAGANPNTRGLLDLRKQKTNWQDYQMLVLPGGFSFGDNLGAGKIWALELQSYFAEQLNNFVNSGKPVLGICNGFQVLVKSGVLPGNNTPATLTFNSGGHFECRWVSLLPVSNNCVWTQNLDEIYCPVAHGEGNFLSSQQHAEELANNNQIALRYAGSTYPANPNGSIMDIAGICNSAGNVLGLMPHPENHILPMQHPRFTRNEAGNLGLELFKRGVQHAQGFGN